MAVPFEILLVAILGLVAGSSAALLHLRWSWRGAKRAARRARVAPVVPGAALRIVTAAGVLAALALVHTVAFATGLVAFFVTERLGLRRAAAGEEPWTPFS